MRRPILLLLLITALTLSATAQEGGGHTLFGDFTVDEGKATGAKPITFHLVLYAIRGHPVDRQMVNSNGRYRFYNVPNGEYYISVEVENREITRILVRLSELRKTDIRRDIALEWKADSNGGGRLPPSSVSAKEDYKRDSANQALLGKAEEAIRNKDNEQAISLLKQIAASDPKDYVALTELGTAYFRQQRLDDSEKSYQQALQANSSFILALLNLGKLRIAKKNFEGAIEVLDKAVKEQPQSADANFYIGEAYLQIKKGSKAVGYLYEAIRLDPMGKAEAHLRLAALYKGAGLKEKAVAEYELFLSKKPDFPEREKIQQYIKENKK